SLPPGVKVMQRAATAADGETCRSSNGCADVVLGLPRSRVQWQSPGKACGNRRRQRAARAMCVFGHDAGCCKAQTSTGLDQKIDALRAISMSALDQNSMRALREKLLRLCAHLVFVSGGRGIEQ